MADLYLLGVFEDAAQKDFLTGLVETGAAKMGWGVLWEVRLTSGCRFDYLNQHLRHAPFANGVVIGVDGKKQRPADKVRAMQGHLDAPIPEGVPTLWAVACPSVEAWMLADPEALPTVVKQTYGDCTSANQPPHPRSERHAKDALSDWAEALAGDQLMQGGREHAEAIARALSADRLSASRNPDLVTLLRTDLPTFLLACTRTG